MKILIVDDDPDILNMLWKFMTLEFPVIELDRAGNGIDALKKISEASIEDKPDLIITDMKMPGANGVEVCRIARKAIKGVKVALMTALEGEYPCFDEIFFKPLEVDSIFNFIRKNWV